MAITARLDNDIAIVTGGASGIGRAIATRYVEEGATVIIADIDVEGGRAVAEDLGDVAHFVETDVTERTGVSTLIRTTVSEFGGLDVLVNNAGGVRSDGKIHEIDEETWRANVDLNLLGPFLCTKHALPHLVDTDGRIVNMSSINGLIGLGHTAYSAAKGGLISMTKLIASQYGRHGIRANAICPGEITTEVHEYSSAPDPVRDEWLDQFPLRRFGEPEEVADVALFLASDESSYVNGAKIVVDGGMIAGRNQRLQEVTYDVAEPPSD